MLQKLLSSNRSWFTLIPSILLVLTLAGCPGGKQDTLPNPSSPVYGEMVTAFYTGLAALEGGGTIRLENGGTISAEEQFKKSTELVPGEPAGWANLGLIQLRQSQMEAAAENLNKAQTLAPDSADVEVLQGLLFRQQGQFDKAIEHLNNAAKLNPNDLKIRYSLKEALEQQGGPDTDAKVGAVLEEMLKLQPNNLALLIEQARTAAAQGNKETLRKAVDKIGQFSPSWPAEVVEQYKTLKAAANGANTRLAAPQARILGNVLKQIFTYRQALEAVQPSSNQIGQPIEQFLKLQPASSVPSPPDTALTFTTTPLAGAGTANSRWNVVRAVWLLSKGRPMSAPVGVSPTSVEKPIILAANNKEVRRVDAPGITLAFPGGSGTESPGPDSLLALDWNWDFKTDLVCAGAGGVRLYQQVAGGKFNDIALRSGIAAVVAKTSLFGAWAADIDADSDLDIVLGTRSGPASVLRNNRDGTFKQLKPFGSVSGMRAFAWGDVDGDGDPDAGIIDAQGTLHVFNNERSGQFRERTVPATVGKVAAVTVADVNGDGLLDLVALQQDGTIHRLSSKADGADWDVADLAKWDGPPQGLSGGNTQLFVQDLDNNAGFDLLAATSGNGGTTQGQATQTWLADATGKYTPLQARVDANVFSVADLNNDGLLDLAGLSSAAQPIQLINKSTKNYNWHVLRPVAGTIADKRPDNGQEINSFGIGGEIGLRSGLLYQKQPITGPVLHYGLGDQPQAQVARSIWPNGAAQAQAEFQIKSDQAVLFVQRLQTSCPYLFTWNGKQMSFVTDCIWRSPLGLKINAQDTAGVMQTEDWLKIRSDQLAPREGFYDLRITAELWETHFFDHVGLMTVDHPVGTEIWVDERLAFPQPPLEVYATRPARQFAGVSDDRGKDVTEIVRSRDANYLAGFGRTVFRGVTRDHWVEMELGDDVPRNKPLWLIANGWIRPTNSSINVAIGQGKHEPPRGLSLEVPDAKGNWVVARPGLGFPEGKVKTILINLDGVFRPGAPRRLRLRTNLEIFWDMLAWAESMPKASLKKQRLKAHEADLHYRGFSELAAKDESSPDMPVSYDKLGGTNQRWRDLTGYYTRFGDVRELMTKVDDRYVIMNAGDEMSFRFPAPPPPPAGWVRDFVMIGDGWVKDGDYNTTFSKTVLPLPAHNRADYTTPPGRLQDDPVYKLHKQDWRDYHTRYVTPLEFQNTLVPATKRSMPF